MTNVYFVAFKNLDTKYTLTELIEAESHDEAFRLACDANPKIFSVKLECVVWRVPDKTGESRIMDLGQSLFRAELTK